MIDINLNRDAFNRIKKPNLILCNANYKKIYTIPADFMRNMSADFYMNNISSITFKCYKYINTKDGCRIKSPNYEGLEKNNKLLWENKSYFIITDCEDCIDNDGSEYKDITIKTCDAELSDKLITDIGNYNSIEDEDTNASDVNLYSIYDGSDVNHSLLHICIAEAKNWTIGDVDPNIPNIENKHSFSIDSTNVYDLLTGDMCDSWECVVIFDTLNRKINVYAKDNPKIYIETGIYLSCSNLIKDFNLSISETFPTRYRVMGGADEFASSNINVTITDVNMGSNYVTNYTYVYDKFSDILKQHYAQYNEALNTYKPLYETALSGLSTLYQDYYSLYNKTPSATGNEIWTEYGYYELETAYDSYNTVISAYASLGGKSEVTLTQKNNAVTKLAQIEAEMIVRDKQIDAKLALITTKLSTINTYITAMEMRTFFTNEDLLELDNYTVTLDYSDSTFCTYDTDSESHCLDVKKELKEKAESDLALSAQPQYEMEITLCDLFAMPEFKNYADQISLGCMMRINYDKYMKNSNCILDARLVEVKFDFDNLESLSLVFSNKSLLDKFSLSDIQKQASSSTSYIAINNTNNKSANTKASSVAKILSDTLVAMNNKISNTKDNEVTWTEGGIDIKKKMSDGSYSPERMKITNGQLCLTSDSWRTISVGIGEITLPSLDGSGATRTGYGIAGDIILGRIFVGQECYIQNSSGTMSMTENGFRVYNSKNDIILNPSDSSGEIFKILSNGTKILYFNSSGQLMIKGNLEAGSINLGSGAFIVDGNGNVTMTKGSINLGSGAFVVDNNGNMSMTKGSINVNNRFKVSTNGDVTLPDNATLSWGQISGTQNVANIDQIPTTEQITTITKNTVTTSYVNALGITASWVYCENLLGSTITGKTINGGTINGTTIYSTDTTTGGITTISGGNITTDGGVRIMRGGMVSPIYQLGSSSGSYYGALTTTSMYDFYYSGYKVLTEFNTNMSNYQLVANMGAYQTTSGMGAYAKTNYVDSQINNVMNSLNSLAQRVSALE